MTTTTVICIVPVKNEAWILERFLKCTSLWADHIIIADQQSNDGSLEIAKRFPKVRIVSNSSPIYNESERQKLLIDEARKIPGKRMLIALDADEVLSSNVLNSLEWETLLNAPEGTTIYANRINLLSDMNSYWIGDADYFFGFIDDGSEHSGNKIHSPRLPYSSNSSKIILRDINIMHYQFTDWARMRSKHNWYQCWERINFPQKRAADIYRRYNYMYCITDKIKPFQREWFEEYEVEKIDMTSISSQKVFWWDLEVAELCTKHGLKKFKKLKIWEQDWLTTLNDIASKEKDIDFCDPRNILDKVIHKLLLITQSRSRSLLVRLFDKVITFLGW